jgi:hypothetical protein
MIFSKHPSFDKEINKFLKKHHQSDDWIFKLQNLLEAHFETRTTRLNINILAPIGEYLDYKIYKIYMTIGGISKKNMPRVCFAQNDKDIIFLCFGTHINNYKTIELISISKKRIKEFIGL